MKVCLVIVLGLGMAAHVLPGRASAHEFSLGVYATGAEAQAMVVEAVRGALLAADERDAHGDETSDGHLGGVDVHLVPLPDGRRLTLPELKNAHQGALDLVLVLGGAGTADGIAGVTDITVVFETGVLPDRASWGSADRQGFAARYQAAWGAAPGVHAASGYNAARRLELAIRPQDGVADRAALRRSLDETADGVAW